MQEFEAEAVERCLACEAVGTKGELLWRDRIIVCALDRSVCLFTPAAVPPDNASGLALTFGHNGLASEATLHAFAPP